MDFSLGFTTEKVKRQLHFTGKYNGKKNKFFFVLKHIK